MPRDRYAVLRFIIAVFFLVTFSLIGLHERLRIQQHGHAAEPARLTPVAFVSRWP